MTVMLDEVAGGHTDPLVIGWNALRDRGLLSVDGLRDRREELDTVRAVAAGDLALGRVFDGHRNAVERLVHHRPRDVPADELEAAQSGTVALGVWGAEPGPGDGPPATLQPAADKPSGFVLRGVKTFCSGAGLLDRAIVLVRRAPDAPPILPVLVDLRTPDTIEIDRTWFAGSALRESRSDRVVFHDAPVLAVLGTEGTLSEDPWISGDALRSSAVWAGGVDTILMRMAAGAGSGEVELARLGTARAIRASVDVWLDAGLSAVERAHDGGAPPADLIAAMRLELTERIRELLRLSAEVTGSRGLVSDRALSRSREGLDLLLLQHRLAPVAVRLGRALRDGETR